MHSQHLSLPVLPTGPTTLESTISPAAIALMDLSTALMPAVMPSERPLEALETLERQEMELEEGLGLATSIHPVLSVLASSS